MPLWNKDLIPKIKGLRGRVSSVEDAEKLNKALLDLKSKNQEIDIGPATGFLVEEAREMIIRKEMTKRANFFEMVKSDLEKYRSIKMGLTIEAEPAQNVESLSA